MAERLPTGGEIVDPHVTIAEFLDQTAARAEHFLQLFNNYSGSFLVDFQRKELDGLNADIGEVVHVINSWLLELGGTPVEINDRLAEETVIGSIVQCQGYDLESHTWGVLLLQEDPNSPEGYTTMPYALQTGELLNGYLAATKVGPQPGTQLAY